MRQSSAVGVAYSCQSNTFIHGLQCVYTWAMCVKDKHWLESDSFSSVLVVMSRFVKENVTKFRQKNL